MYEVFFLNSFKHDVKLCKRRGLDLQLLEVAVDLLRGNGSLPKSYRPHILTGNYKGLWEAHLAPDWLLVWKQNDERLVLMFTSTGTHSDLFG